LWKTYLGGKPFGDFDILPGAGYFVYCKKKSIYSPNRIKLSNIRDTQFTVSWVSAKEERGEIRYSVDGKSWSIAYDDRGEGFVGDTHHVTIKGLTPGITYLYDIISSGLLDDASSLHYKITTGPSIIPEGSYQVSGKVWLEDGETPAKGKIVYIRILDEDEVGSSGESSLTSVLVDEGGFWFTDLVNFRTEDLSSLFEYSTSGDKLLITFEGGKDGVGSLEVDTGAARPAPDVVLERPDT
jgi:hypothetical protein